MSIHLLDDELFYYLLTLDNYDKSDDENNKNNNTEDTFTLSENIFKIKNHPNLKLTIFEFKLLYKIFSCNQTGFKLANPTFYHNNTFESKKLYFSKVEILSSLDFKSIDVGNIAVFDSLLNKLSDIIIKTSFSKKHKNFHLNINQAVSLIYGYEDYSSLVPVTNSIEDKFGGVSYIHLSEFFYKTLLNFYKNKFSNQVMELDDKTIFFFTYFHNDRGSSFEFTKKWILDLLSLDKDDYSFKLKDVLKKLKHIGFLSNYMITEETITFSITSYTLCT